VAKWPITKGQQCGVIQYQNYILNFKVTFKLNLQFGAHTVSRLSPLQPPVCLEMAFKRRNLFHFFFLSHMEACNDAALPLKSLYPLPSPAATTISWKTQIATWFLVNAS